LDDNQLTGSISPLVGKLTKLEILEFYGNQLSGSLPDTIYTMPELEVVRVGDNRLSGTLSDRLTLLNQTLREFNAPNNNFNGAWPNQVFEALIGLSKSALVVFVYC